MNDAFDIRGESHIEVHKFRAGAIVIATLLALVIQSSSPVHFSKAAILDLPLLVTIYFGLSRRNPSTGLLLGMAIGLLQDSRFALTAAFFVAHQGVIVLTRRMLLSQPEAWLNMHLIVASLVNGLVAVFLFLLLDRLRKN